jgi:hypothetical protein
LQDGQHRPHRVQPAPAAPRPLHLGPNLASVGPGRV